MEIKQSLRKVGEKHFLIIFIIYILSIFTWVVFGLKIHWTFKILFTTPLIFSISLFLSKVLTYFNKTTNPFFYKITNYYDRTVDWKYNIFDKNKFPKKKKKKPEWDKVILFFFFIMVPMYFFPFLSMGSWQNEQGFTQISGINSGNIIDNNYIKNGTVNVDTLIDFDTLQEMSYLIGKEINKLPLDICLKNNGVPSKGYIEETIETKVKINDGDWIKTSLGKEECVPLDISKKTIDYVWNSTYKTNISKLNEEIPLERSFTSPTEERIKINLVNLLFISVVMTLGYWAVLIILIRVFLYLYKGLELKKE